MEESAAWAEEVAWIVFLKELDETEEFGVNILVFEVEPREGSEGAVEVGACDCKAGKGGGREVAGDVLEEFGG